MKVKRPEISFLKKFFLVDLIKGLLLTFSYQRPSANYTEQYPKERPKIAERFRGAPRLNNDPVTGETLCIACNLCALACPEDCIEVRWERDASGRKALTTFTFDLSRCMFCGLCEDACPTPAIELTQDFELAHYGRKGMKWDRQTLEQGNQSVVYRR
jgi:NADH-quinone oxidoreductase subunit I